MTGRSWYRPQYVLDAFDGRRWSAAFRSHEREAAAVRFALEKRRPAVRGLLLWLDRPGQPPQLLLSWNPETVPGRRWDLFRILPSGAAERLEAVPGRTAGRSGLRRALARARWLASDVRRAWREGGARCPGGRSGW